MPCLEIHVRREGSRVICSGCYRTGCRRVSLRCKATRSDPDGTGVRQVMAADAQHRGWVASWQAHDLSVARADGPPCFHVICILFALCLVQCRYASRLDEDLNEKRADRAFSDEADILYPIVESERNGTAHAAAGRRD
ncbi:hypothetical protein VFPFJ_01322 [Purpureocillium lilacinum]|uniref:Uncharacterized protein n=1 Tax=Purpureocillium lilacinum TaxID=33203 RepID=A0A179I0Z9_PURLI|nr:hypothetical protein VFPFJ_01322 [Purpureocillium lilacinum]OAQ87260.1 hypothetical protein VFPBJ_01300 [Purpureocillium lilacinum]OAQ95213.1 hypothetical protein VFPFJ_01322 [Purpureocillium lilacinum]